MVKTKVRPHSFWKKDLKISLRACILSGVHTQLLHKIITFANLWKLYFLAIIFMPWHNGVLSIVLLDWRLCHGEQCLTEPRTLWAYSEQSVRPTEPGIIDRDTKMVAHLNGGDERLYLLGLQQSSCQESFGYCCQPPRWILGMWGRWKN